MSGPLGRAIAEVAISVAVSAGKRALKKAMNDPAKPRAIATARDRPMPAMAKFLQLRSRGRYRNGTHAHAAAELACMQDLRPGALDETETDFLRAWRKQENIVELPWTKLAGFPAAATSTRLDWDGEEDGNNDEAPSPVIGMRYKSQSSKAAESQVERDPRIELVKGWAFSSVAWWQLLSLGPPQPSAIVAAPSMGLLGGIAWICIQEKRGTKWVVGEQQPPRRISPVVRALRRPLSEKELASVATVSPFFLDVQEASRRPSAATQSALRRKAISAHATLLGCQRSAEQIYSNWTLQGYSYGSPTHAAAVLATLPPDQLMQVERDFLAALDKASFKELRLASVEEASRIVQEEAAGAAGSPHLKTDDTLVDDTVVSGPSAAAATTATKAANTASASGAGEFNTKAANTPTSGNPTTPGNVRKHQLLHEREEVWSGLPRRGTGIGVQDTIFGHTYAASAQPSPPSATADAAAAAARSRNPLTQPVTIAASGEPAGTTWGDFENTGISSFSSGGFTASRLGWVLVGSLFRAPIVGGLRVVGAKMASSTFFGSQLLGAALVALCAIAELDSDYFNPPDPNAPRPDVPLEPTPLPHVQLLRERYVPIPSSWRAASLVDKVTASHADTRCRRVPADESVRLTIERAMHATAHAQCVGVDGTGNTRRAKVLSVERVENLPLWKQYWHKKHEMVDTHHANNVHVKPLNPPAVPLDRAAGKGKGGPGGVLDVDMLLEPGLNEVYLFHGTTREVADIITHHGFDERVGNLSGLYGAGVYFANQSCKAAQYAKDSGVKTLIVARVTLGDAYYTTGHLTQYRRPPERDTRVGWKPGFTYDCVVANSGGSQAHRELIVYDHRVMLRRASNLDSGTILPTPQLVANRCRADSRPRFESCWNSKLILSMWCDFASRIPNTTSVQAKIINRVYCNVCNQTVKLIFQSISPLHAHQSSSCESSSPSSSSSSSSSPNISK